MSCPEELWHDEKVLLALEQHYGSASRHTEQAALLARALGHVRDKLDRESSDADSPAQTELKNSSGPCCCGLPGYSATRWRPGWAIASYELIVAAWPQERQALQALAGLYGKVERTRI